jgi:hypothetical protein
MYAAARNASGVWASFWYCRSCGVERSFALLSRDGFRHVRVAPLSTDGQGDAWAAPTGVFVVSSGLAGPVQVVTPYGAVSTVRGVALDPPQPSGTDEVVVTSYGVGPPNVPIVIDGETLRKWPLTVPRLGDRGAVDIVQSFHDGLDLWGLHIAGPGRAPGIVHSADGGRTWLSFAAPPPDRAPAARGVSLLGRPLVSAGGRTFGFLWQLHSQAAAQVVLSRDGGETWMRSGAPRDTRGRRIAVTDAALGASGSLVVSGTDARGVPRVWVGPAGVADYQSLRPALQEAVTFAPPPLDHPRALWATAAKAIWESDDGGRTWRLLAGQQTWQGLEVVD